MPLAKGWTVRQKSLSIGLIFWLLFYQENGEALLSTLKKQTHCEKK